MLERFRIAKQKELAQLREDMENGLCGEPLLRKPGVFSGALRNSPKLPAVIAEYKRASPSKGIICGNLSPEDAALAYAGAGAAALSILTETEFFNGEFEYMARAATVVDLPVLRKDFIFDPLQIMHTATSPAAALLLIVRFVPDAKKLRDLRELAQKYNLECVVEIFDQRDLVVARESGAEIIQVNARDLDSLHVDRQACLKLIEVARPTTGELWIAASGMENGNHLKEAASAGYQAVLVGSALMAGGEPGSALARMLADRDKAC